jgi:hypothetical protein
MPAGIERRRGVGGVLPARVQWNDHRIHRHRSSARSIRFRGDPPAEHPASCRAFGAVGINMVLLRWFIVLDANHHPPVSLPTQ